ncbi:MAG: tartrate dehydrogenase [Planctomycetaceae bacterium]|nr:tartrate dehydrogenase [Planctomycetaceae bacterium]|tara:strand:- start:3620 stop:4678 length:1059 start_codon:yes stop_codon:yes gene_type:complete
MTQFEIALYPGDGIGPDVLQQAVRVMQSIGERHGIRFKFKTLDWGYEYWKEHGRVVPEGFLDEIRDVDSILLGAVGWPEDIPDHVTLAPLVQIRQAFDQYACVRPANLFPGLKSVLAGRSADDIDFIVIRENSEGEYIDNGGRFKQGTPDEVAVQTAVHTRKGVERILRFGFETARRRRGRLTMATKSNAQKYSYVMWDSILEELTPEYPDVEAERMHCDAAVMNLVRWPDQFDVIVASNLFGDLLTDLGGILGGGLGLAPSSNENPSREFPSMFEPVHGSAPDIAGLGIANPIAAILSVAMMLDHLECPAAAHDVRVAVEKALLEGAMTPDLGGHLTTIEMGDAVLASLHD